MPTLEERAKEVAEDSKLIVGHPIIAHAYYYHAIELIADQAKEIAHQKETEAKLESSIEAFSELVEIYKETEAELEKVIMMIYGRGHLDFDDEGWDLYEKVTEQILSKQRNKNDG